MKIVSTAKKTASGSVKVMLVDGKRIRSIQKGKKEHLEIGIGKKSDINNRKLILLARKIVQTAKEQKIKRIAVSFPDFLFPKLKTMNHGELASLLSQNFEMANFEFRKFKEKPKDGWDDVTHVTILESTNSAIQNACIMGQRIGQAVNQCRDLANTPGGDMTPTTLAEEAKKAVQDTKVQVKVLGQKELEKLKMGAILGVSRGSVEEPKFIIMEYWGAGKAAKKSVARGVNRSAHGADQHHPVVLIGKGVTFDTGGLNLKGDEGMLGMHLDMSGGAAVIHAVALAAKLKFPKNVVGLIPAVENMPSGQSYRPGDVLRSMSGKTIEVLNTDAEGRVILADALTYAKKYNPRLVVDVATLTGAIITALGQHASGIMTPDPKLARLFQELGEESGDYVWPLPLWDEYEQYVKGNFGDVSNIASSGNTRYGGAINGGMFLYQFAKDYPWIHIDISSRITTAQGDNLAKGAAGEPVRLLTKLIETY